jgi:hypothetical protein
VRLSIRVSRKERQTDKTELSRKSSWRAASFGKKDLRGSVVLALHFTTIGAKVTMLDTLGIKNLSPWREGDMHVATKIGLFYAAFWGLEWFGYLSLDHVTLAVPAVFSAGVMEDSRGVAEERRKREIVRRNRHLTIDPNTGKIVRAGPAQNSFYDEDLKRPVP